MLYHAMQVHGPEGGVLSCPGTIISSLSKCSYIQTSPHPFSIYLRLSAKYTVPVVCFGRLTDQIETTPDSRVPTACEAVGLGLHSLINPAFVVQQWRVSILDFRLRA